MTNFIRYQNETQAMAKNPLEKKISMGKYGGAKIDTAGAQGSNNHIIWIPDGVKITNTVSIKTVNGQLVTSPKEDDYIYFWVSGARGNGHNSPKRLLIPLGVEILASGAKEAHTTGCCNQISSVVFRVPKGTKRVVVGDLYYGEHSQAIIFTCNKGKWSVKVEPVPRFQALNPEWPGLWSEEKDGKPSLPLPALIE